MTSDLHPASALSTLANEDMEMTPERPPSDDGITDETLMMFADGKLDKAAMEAVARAIEADAALAERLAVFIATGDRLKGAFAGPVNAQPPERLIAAIMSVGVPGTLAPAGADPTRQGAEIVPFRSRPESVAKPRSAGWLPMAFAAGFAGIAAGVTGFLVGQDSTRPLSAVAALASTGAAALAGLDTARDGQSVLLGSGLAASVSGSYRVADGNICRTLSVNHERSSTLADGVACRNTTGWRVELALPRDAPSSTYRPASGHGPIEALLEARGAQQPLDPGEVDGLIRRNWR